ncbi:MAG TPA: NADH-quinone oxidoreductase subunit J [Chloroflexaceae bacterium]|nr:NADH-quinone oxidoreductase subunit J [Chloroflexaceae bacterium]
MDLVLFIITAAIALGGAVAMLLTRNAVHSALFLLLNFAAIAVLFLLLQSPFLFAIQLTVYAGAIMVLFLFVMMLLGAEQVEATPDRIAWQRPLGLLMGVGLLAIAVLAAFRGGAAAPPPSGEEAAVFGDPASLGALLFTKYMLPFQITGIILLIAVVGVVVLNQRGRQSVQANPPVGD